jgi:hypothetical protein
MRVATLVFSSALVASLGFGVQARAGGDEEADALGTVYITTNLAYPKALVNDDEYGAVEYSAAGKTVLIKNLALKAAPHQVKLTPHEEGYAAESLAIEKKAYKKKRKGKLLGYEARFKVTFKKGAEAPKPAEPKPAEPPKPKPEEPDDL